MIAAEITMTDGVARCAGCRAIGDRDLWWHVAMGFPGDLSFLWLCLKCAKTLGILLLQDRMVVDK